MDEMKRKLQMLEGGVPAGDGRGGLLPDLSLQLLIPGCTSVAIATEERADDTLLIGCCVEGFTVLKVGARLVDSCNGWSGPAAWLGMQSPMEYSQFICVQLVHCCLCYCCCCCCLCYCC